MKYMIVFDEQDKGLIDDMLADKADELREDGDASRDALAARLEALEIVPVPTATPQDDDQATEALSGKH